METWQILQYMDMKKRRNGRKREQEKGWREEYMEGKRVKKKFNLDIVQDKGGEIRNKGGG